MTPAEKKIPLHKLVKCNYTVDWGDGTIDSVTSHTYTKPETYEVTVTVEVTECDGCSEPEKPADPEQVKKACDDYSAKRSLEGAEEEPKQVERTCSSCVYFAKNYYPCKGTEYCDDYKEQK
jgi:hypothetical protein